ncbi:MAG: hypothetical protein NZ518_01590, partial [Dehalococcoidia bacterium]|nr:hypothetical protein [Dehalococcoidia bacterium]
MPKLIFANRASSQLNADITALDTSLVVSPGTGSRFPSPGVNEAFRLTLTDQNGQSEIVECTARTGDQLFVTRGVEGTTPRAFSAGSRVELRLTAGTMASFLQGGALPPLSQDLNFNGFRPINVPWATMTLDVDQIRERGVALVPVTRNIAVGAGLLGGGNLGSDLTLALDF